MAKVLIAKLTSPHGLRGEVKGQFFTDTFDNFKKLMPDTIKTARQAGHDTFIAVVKDVSDRTAAEQIVGMEIFAERDALPATKTDTYYIADLMGMNVKRGNEFLGLVASVHNFGAGDILELDNGEMIPFVNATVDFEEKCILI